MGIVLGCVARYEGSPAEMPQIPFLAWYWFLGFEVASWHVIRRRGGGGRLLHDPAKCIAIRGMNSRGVFAHTLTMNDYCILQA